MRIVPDSTVTLYGGVEIDNGEQLAFSSRNGQTAYFNSKLVRQAVPCTVVRKTGALRLEVPGSVMATCNYLSFVNPSFDNKIVYARIVDYDYINNECVEIAYAIDYWQTWMFDVVFEKTYIEREHLSEEDWDKAEINPYDPSIMEFKTSENLTTSKDLEKLDYTISGQSGDDGLKLALGSHSITTATNTLGVLIRMANINLSNIDEAWIKENPSWDPSAPSALTQLPSWKFVDYLINVMGQNFGFFYLTQPMYDYITSRYPASYGWTAAARITLGAGWTSANISPFQETSFTPPVNYIYDAYGATESNMNHLGDLLETLVTYSTEHNVAENTLVDMKIIPNDIMTLAGTVIATGTPFKAGLSPSQSIQVENKKLMRFPFCYARMIAPNGDIKELQYEKFIDILNGDDTVAYVYVIMDLTDAPTLIVAPSNYKVSGMSGAQNVETNIEEALFFSQFPTMPYSIDAFIAQCAAVTNSVIASRTADAEFEMDKSDLQNNTQLGVWAQRAGSFMGNASAVISQAGKSDVMGATQLGVSLLQFGLDQDMISINQQQQEYREKMWNGSLASLADIGGGEVARQLKLTKAAYAADHYYPSNGVGSINFNYLSFCDIILLNVSLNPDIAAIYDNYFKMYGYTSGRCGIPRVCNYVAGSSTDSEIPHWTTIDGKDTTYVKTMDCKIVSAMLPVANAIKSMFDSGVRMIKGD